jgi:hypothetical protein
MHWFRLRPTFDIPLLESHETAVAKLGNAYAEHPKGKLLMVYGEYGEIHLPATEHRLWSPYLAFCVDRQGEHSKIHGRFAPRIEIWTLVWICYMVCAFSAFFGFMLAFSQYMIGASAWGNWIGMIALALWIALIATAETGQRWSTDQMHGLRAQLEQFLDAARMQRAT